MVGRSHSGTLEFPFKRINTVIPDGEPIWIDERKNILILVNIDILVFYNPHVLFKRFLKIQIHIPIQI
jgi:hypothetical protein